MARGRAAAYAASLISHPIDLHQSEPTWRIKQAAGSATSSGLAASLDFEATLWLTTALDEQLRLPHEHPGIGLVLCKSADKIQVRLALTAAAVKKTGVATYPTTLPDERLIQRRLEQPPNPSETDE